MTHGVTPGVCVLTVLLVAAIIVSPWFLVGAGAFCLWAAKV